MMHRTHLLLILMFSTTVLIAACGQKGDLYLPADDARAALTTDNGY
ncbi:lipoprotein [Saccharospirillum sp.]